MKYSINIPCTLKYFISMDFKENSNEKNNISATIKIFISKQKTIEINIDITMKQKK